MREKRRPYYNNNRVEMMYEEDYDSEDDTISDNSSTNL